ncbi:unnamed protein product (macronuclear) [Paramecium tetraurelia]|uniref:Macro domain-containing protein n=1 Tax=Paramecium tetraurelia TaxID=5888 RepID=A0DKW3_PARTE|nr:uncharacterized protein GSPATT00017997001 [Paramecium tetraurelia]CAK83680.1 unnamed protein product [Paramecium tetraurelia]|eukprot:XP_001451077.1 hypothetical protein (macronuclear) [Paramecium tetraurelia strain d4-2]
MNEEEGILEQCSIIINKNKILEWETVLLEYQLDICGIDEEKKQNLQSESKVITTRTVNQITIQIVQADIVEELVDVVVNSSHEPAWSYISKRDNNKTHDLLQQMRIGELVITNAENVNSVQIFHTRLPFYQDAKDLLQIFNVYKECLKQKGHKSISFTEQNTPNFQIPKQFHAEVLIRAILSAIQEGDVEFELIKFVSLDQLTLKYFAYELMKQLDELKIPELFQLRYQQFLNFLQNGEDAKQEVYLLSTGITTEMEGVVEQQ